MPNTVPDAISLRRVPHLQMILPSETENRKNNMSNFTRIESNFSEIELNPYNLEENSQNG